MDVFNSEWLIQMLNKMSKTPKKRLLALFDILDDWSNAPGISLEAGLNNSLSHHSAIQANPLQTYLGLEAAKAGAALPEALASQLYFMAVSASLEKLQGSNTAALQHAKSVAEAVINAQTKKEFHIAKSSAYAIAASFIGIFVITGALLMFNKPNITKTTKIATSAPLTEPTFVNAGLLASPEKTAALVAQIEQMRHGDCRLLEAIQLPDSYKKVYFENIILGQISTVPSEQKLVKELLSKIRCNYSRTDGKIQIMAAMPVTGIPAVVKPENW